MAEPSGRRLDVAAHRVLWPLTARPSFLVVGAMKAGTTSLYDYLVQLPDVRSARKKELHYFSDNYHKGSRWYRAQFPFAPPGRRRWITGEATPYYLMHPWSAPRIAAELPGVKIVVMVRNPTDRAYSSWTMQSRLGLLSETFEDALAVEQEVFPREHAAVLADPEHDLRLHRLRSYVARGRYVEQLQAWEQHIPRERIHVVISERLFSDPEPELATLHDFLAVAADPAVRFPASNVGSYDRMDPATRERLDAAFHAPNAVLAERIGVDLRALGWS